MTEKYLTAEQAKGMVEEIIGQSLDKFHTEMNERKNDNGDLLKQIADAVGQNKAKAQRAKFTHQDRVEKMTLLMGAIQQSPNDMGAASEIAKAMGDDYVAKALGSSTVAGGSVLIEPQMASEIIELLRAKTVVLESGARTVDMPSGSINFGRVDTGVTAAYRGESTPGTVSQPETGELALKARILDVITPASNQLLSRSRNGQQFIQDELVAGAKDKMDVTFIRSDGTQDKPKGLLHWAAAANKFNETNATGTTGASTAAEITQNLGKAMRLLKDGNVQGIRLGWLLAPRSWQRLITERDGNSNLIWAEEMSRGTLYGVPFKDTTNIPTNLTAASTSGSGTDASEVYLADFWNVLVGETEMLEISMSEHASYTVGGAQVSAFERGEVLTRVTMEHDLAARHSTAIVVIESVTWGTV